MKVDSDATEMGKERPLKYSQPDDHRCRLEIHVNSLDRGVLKACEFMTCS